MVLLCHLGMMSYTLSKYETLRIWDSFQCVGRNLRFLVRTLLLALALTSILILVLLLVDLSWF